MGYSWETLIGLAHEPEKFVELLNSDKLTPTELSFAAEIGGLALESEVVFDTLFKLLDHKSAIVREGALLGLESQDYITDALLAKIKNMMINDPGEGVRTVAQEVYENF